MLYWIFTVILGGTALYFDPNMELTFDLAKGSFFMGAVDIAVIAGIFTIIKNKKIAYIKGHKWFWIFLSVFVATTILATIFSSFPELSFWGGYERRQGLIMFLHYIMLFGLAIMFLHEKKKISRTINILCIVGAVIGYLALGQMFFPVLTKFWNVASLWPKVTLGTIGNANLLGSFMVILIPFAFSNYVKKSSWWIVALIGIIIGVVFSFSRGAYLGLLAEIILALILFRKQLLGVTIAGVIAVLFIIANVFSGALGIDDDPFFQRFLVDTQDLRSVETRFAIWPASLDLIKEHPLLGAGPETFAENFQKVMPLKLQYIEKMGNYPDRAHNELIDIAYNIGIPGLLAYLSMLVYLLLIAFKSNKEPLITSSVLGLFGLFVTNMFGFSVTVHFALWWFLVAVIIVSSGKRKYKKINLSAKILAPLIIILIILSLKFAVINPYIADYYYSNSKQTLINGEYDSSMVEIEKAIHLSPDVQKYRLDATSASINNNDLIKASEYLSKTYPSVNSLYLNAKLNNLKGEYKLADEYYMRLFEVAPTRTDGLSNWARMHYQNGEKEKAFNVYGKFVGQIPYYYVPTMSNRKKEILDAFVRHNKTFLNFLLN